MNEAIKLKVPEKPSAEKVSIGNLEADLTGSAVETTNRKFADYLIENFGLEEILPKKKKSDAAKTEVKDFGFAEDFPGKAIFESFEIPFATVQGLTKDQLTKVEGIGEATADQILNYKFKPVAVEPAENTPSGEQDGQSGETGGDNSNAGENNGGQE